MNYEALALRLEKGEAGREIDAQLWMLIDDRPLEAPDGRAEKHYKRDPNDTIAFEIPPPFSTSLDSAMNLVEKARPGWLRSVDEQDPHDKHYVDKWWALVENGPDDYGASRHGPTAPAALLAALLMTFWEPEVPPTGVYR